MNTKKVASGNRSENSVDLKKAIEFTACQFNKQTLSVTTRNTQCQCQEIRDYLHELLVLKNTIKDTFHLQKEIQNHFNFERRWVDFQHIAKKTLYQEVVSLEVNHGNYSFCSKNGSKLLAVTFSWSSPTFQASDCKGQAL